MNKKVQKGLVAAVAATMGASVVAPTAFAASQTQNVSLAAEYEAAYNATAKATASKDQKELTSARVLVDALYNRVKGTAEEYLATTLSSILDPVQHVKLVAFFDAMKKAEVSEKQADINAAQALIIDMPQVWRNSYSTAMDAIQQKLIDKVVEATKKAQASSADVDKTAAQALLDEVKTATNNAGVENWAKAYQATLDAIVTTPRVAAVNAINAKQIEVKFTTPVEETTVLDINGNLVNTVKIDDQSGYEGELDETGRVLTITLTSASAKDSVKYIKVNGVKTPNGTAIPTYAQAVKFDEKVAPTIKEVKSVTKEDKTKEVVVKFSEPVKFSSAKIDGKVVSSALPSDDGFGAEYTFKTVDDLETGKTYDIEIAGLKDLLENKAENDITKGSVTVTKDTVAPTFTLKAVNETTFDVVFDKEMKDEVRVDAIKVTKLDNNGNEVVLPLSKLPAYRADEKTLRVNLFSAPFVGKETSKEISVSVKELSDKVGNKVSSKTDKVTLTLDAVKPTVKAVSQNGLDDTQKTLNVEFSEAVVKVGGETEIFSVTDESGKIVKTAGGSDITVTGVALNSTGTKATVTMSAALPTSGTYKLVAKQGMLQDKATTPNKNEAQVLTFSYVKDAGTVSQLEATIDGTTTDSAKANRKVVVKFNQADVVSGLSNATGTYKEGAADDAANYTLNGSALPEGTKVVWGTVVDGVNDYVTLDFSAVKDADLPTALKQGGNISVSVANVKTEAGSTVAYTAKTIAVKDSTAPRMTSAYVQGNQADGYTLTVMFSEDLDTIVAEDITKFGYDSDATTVESANLIDKTFANVATNKIEQDSTDKSRVVITIKDVANADALNEALSKSGTLTFGLASNGGAIQDTATPKVDARFAKFAADSEFNTAEEAKAATTVQLAEYVSNLVSSTVSTTQGTPGVAGANQVSTIKVLTGSGATGGTIKVDGTDVVIAPSTTAQADVATAIKNAVTADTTSAWTVTATGDTLTFTAKAKVANVDAIPVVTADGITFEAQKDTTKGVVAVAGTDEKVTITINGGAYVAKTINVTLGSTVVSVSIAANDTASVIAGKINTAIQAATGTLGYTSTVAGNVVTLTSTTSATNVADLAVAVSQ